MITNSLEWSNKRAGYLQQIKALPYSKDIRNMLINLDNMISKLSKAEVEARRKHLDTMQLPELKEVNEACQVLEKWLVMGTLLR